MTDPKRIPEQGKLQEKETSSQGQGAGLASNKYYLYAYALNSTLSRLKHYKCDEARPFCGRCAKAEWKCEYPSDTSGRPVVGHTQVSKLAPKPALVPIKTNPDDGNYLQYAHSLYNHNPVASFQIPLWSLLLQLAQCEPCIRHITIGTVMMHHVSAGGTQDPKKSNRQQILNAGLGHYGNSIKALQRLLNRANGKADKATWEISILASYLMSSFETLVGDEESAFNQMQSGFNLVKNRLVDHKFDAEHAGNLEELAYAFNRLDIRLSTYDASYHTKALIEPKVPESFRTLTHAKHVLEAIIPNILVLIRIPSQETNIPRTFPGENIPLEVLSKLKGFKDLLQKWFQNLKKLSATLGLNLSAPAFGPLNIRAHSSHHVLMNQYWMCVIWLETAFSTSQTAFDPFFPIFSEITRLAELIITMQPERQCLWQKHKFYYTAETPFLHPLFYTAQKCRDGRLRRRALHLLKLAGSEGVFEGRSSAAAVEWVIEQEEAGLPEGVIGSVDPNSGGYVEERWRMRGADIRINRLAKSLDITCTRVGADGVEEVVMGKTTWIQRCNHHQKPNIVEDSKKDLQKASFFG